MMQRQKSFEGEGKRQSTGSGQNASTLLWQGIFKSARAAVLRCAGAEGRRCGVRGILNCLVQQGA